MDITNTEGIDFYDIEIYKLFNNMNISKKVLLEVYNIHKKFQDNPHLKYCYLTPLSYSCWDVCEVLIKLGYDIKDANLIPGIFLITNKNR